MVKLLRLEANILLIEPPTVLWNLGVDYVQGHYFQKADSGLSYEFGTESTLSSEITSPQWASR